MTIQVDFNMHFPTVCRIFREQFSRHFVHKGLGNTPVVSAKLEMARKELRDDVFWDARAPLTLLELPGTNADPSPPGVFKNAFDGITELFRNPTPDTPPEL